MNGRRTAEPEAPKGNKHFIIRSVEPLSFRIRTNVFSLGTAHFVISKWTEETDEL
jgi:hypothetical protein